MSWKLIVLAALLGFASAWGIQGLRWDGQTAKAAQAAAYAQSEAVGQVNYQLIKARTDTEEIRKVFVAYKEGVKLETDDLRNRLNAGTAGVFVKASCPAVHAVGTVASGTGSNTAQLTPQAGRDYVDWQQAYREQYGLLIMCRSELVKRSAKSSQGSAQ